MPVPIGSGLFFEIVSLSDLPARRRQGLPGHERSERGKDPHRSLPAALHALTPRLQTTRPKKPSHPKRSRRLTMRSWQHERSGLETARRTNLGGPMLRGRPPIIVCRRIYTSAPDRRHCALQLIGRRRMGQGGPPRRSGAWRASPRTCHRPGSAPCEAPRSFFASLAALKETLSGKSGGGLPGSTGSMSIREVFWQHANRYRSGLLCPENSVAAAPI